MAHLLGLWETVFSLLPALVANASPVLLKGHGHPIDGGRLFIDGRPLLGKGKTYEGFLLGVLYGSIVAYFFSAITGQPLVAAAGSIAAAGALLGDMLGAFIKRRLGLERGAPAPILDQLDFYAGALISMTLLGYLPAPIPAMVLGLLIPVLHRATNIAAYKLGLKNVPW